MDAFATPLAQPHARAFARVTLPPGLAPWLLGFAPVVYLALSGGGYDLVARSEVGIVLWWVLLLGVIVAGLPRRRFSGSAWVPALLLGGFLAWTWIAVGWSQSAERSLAEVARVATYLGVFLLGLSVVSRATLRDLLNGLATAVAVVSALAVLSRLVPAWFPADTAKGFYATSRLSYPFDYADAVGEFAALGVPLLLYVANEARTLWGRALAAAAIPVVVLCLGLTVSRGGVLAAVVGLVAFFALAPDRLPALATTLDAAVGSTAVMYALLHRAPVRDGFLSAAAAGQRHAVLAVLVLACVGVGLIQIGIALATRHGMRPRWLRPSRRFAALVGATLVAAIAAAVIAGVVSGTDHQLWQEFKRPNATAHGNQYFRLFSLSGSHRYQYWKAAIDAFDTSQWKGIGPGTFEFYWAQHNTLAEFVRNAHSLYLETLAELGIVGLALIGGFIAAVLIGGVVRALRAPRPTRAAIAAAVAAFAAFCAAAGFDWVWQIGAIPLVGLLLAAAAMADLRRADGARAPGPIFTRVTLGLTAIVALIAIVVPLAATVAVRSSQAAVRAGAYRSALGDAASAQRLEASAAAPRLQRALILERLGDVAGAGDAIDEAEARAPTDWRIWLVASRIATEANEPRLALADYRRARALNPTSPIFAR